MTKRAILKIGKTTSHVKLIVDGKDIAPALHLTSVNLGSYRPDSIVTVTLTARMDVEVNHDETLP